ncbi:MAG: TetR/AcrR family transcriptional regulator [Deltaproteobacteria bacterium]|nr:TetR/AcrR family transcriptional regulator [Deltaproteobacteria bacterium]
MARPREYDENEVLEKALEAFWAHGFEATSLADLMDATGLAKGSLYKGFGDKRSLFLRALDHYLERGRAGLSDLANDSRSGAELLRDWLGHVVSMATCTGLRKGCMSVNCTIELAPHDDDIRKRLRKHERQVEALYARLIERGIEDGSLRAELDTQASAEWLTTIVDGLQVRGKLGLTRAQANSAVEMAMSALEAR